MEYSKLVLSRPKFSFQDWLSHNAGPKYCRMLNGSILQYWPALSYQCFFCLFMSRSYCIPSIKIGWKHLAKFNCMEYSIRMGLKMIAKFFSRKNHQTGWSIPSIKIGQKVIPYLKRLSLQLWTFFEIFYFVFKSFVNVELSYVFTVYLFTIAENCTEKWIIKQVCFSLVCNYLRTSNNYMHLILT